MRLYQKQIEYYIKMIPDRTLWSAFRHRTVDILFDKEKMSKLEVVYARLLPKGSFQAFSEAMSEVLNGR